MADEPKNARNTRQDPAALTWAREAKGWSRQDIAKACGVSHAHWCRLETGASNATPKIMITIAEVLNCPTSILERKIDWPRLPQRAA